MVSGGFVEYSRVKRDDYLFHYVEMSVFLRRGLSVPTESLHLSSSLNVVLVVNRELSN